jgi:hypothetical protein
LQYKLPAPAYDPFNLRFLVNQLMLDMEHVKAQMEIAVEALKQLEGYLDALVALDEAPHRQDRG